MSQAIAEYLSVTDIVLRNYLDLIENKQDSKKAGLEHKMKVPPRTVPAVVALVLVRHRLWLSDIVRNTLCCASGVGHTGV